MHATDAATASRMALFDLGGLRWDADLVRGFGLEEQALPEIRPTCGDFGTIRHPDVPTEVPITADAVDAHAALFAQRCWDETSVKATYGTGAFIETFVPIGSGGLNNASGMTFTHTDPATLAYLGDAAPAAESSAAAVDQALLAWLVFDSSEDDDTDLLAAQAADKLALVLFE